MIYYARNQSKCDRSGNHDAAIRNAWHQQLVQGNEDARIECNQRAGAQTTTELKTRTAESMFMADKGARAKQEGRGMVRRTYSVRSPSWRRTPTSPAMATPSRTASGSCWSAARYRSRPPSAYSFRTVCRDRGIAPRNPRDASSSSSLPW